MDKLTNKETRKQIYLEIQALKKQLAKQDEEIKEWKETEKEDWVDILKSSGKVLGIGLAGLIVTGALFVGVGYLTLPMAGSFLRSAILGLTLGVGLTGTLIADDDPFFWLKDAVEELISTKQYTKEEKAKRQAIVDKLNMLENMTEKELDEYAQLRQEKDKKGMDALTYFSLKEHAQKNKHKHTRGQKDIVVEEPVKQKEANEEK